jgi:hypothetical protein
MSLFRIRTCREVKSLKYFVPDLKELADIFRTALQSNFKIVEVTVGDCPDLREWGLAGQGLHSSGHLKGYHDSTQSHIISQSQATCLVDVGGINNMNFIKNHYHLWDLTDIAHDVHLSDQAFFIGAGAASSRVAGDNWSVRVSRVPSTRALASTQYIALNTGNQTVFEQQHVQSYDTHSFCQ